MYFLVIIYLIYQAINNYHRVNSLIINSKIKETKHNKYKLIKFILLFKKGDNIDESIKSLIKMENIEIIIIGKNIKIKHPNIKKIFNQDYSESIVRSVIKQFARPNEVIGVFRANTIFDRNLSDRILDYYNCNQINRVFILSNVITNNKYIEKYNFYNQLNNYANKPIYDYFTNLSNNPDIILTNFLITKIINLNSFNYLFYGESSLKNYFLLIIKYILIINFPSLLLIAYLIQLIKQTLLIYSNLTYNQALEADVPYIIIANFLSFIRDFLPKKNFELAKLSVKINDSLIIPKIKLIKKIDYGAYYLVEDSNLEILHLYGSSYQKGFAHGKLCKHHFEKMVATMNTLCQNLKPNNIDLDKIRNKHDNVKDCLLEIYNKLENFINLEHKDEIKGLSDGSNIEISDIQAISVIPELYHQHCMLLNKLDNDDSIFLRTLDFFFYCDTHILRIYHNENKNSYCELGIPGSIWTMTAVSEKLICIGETSGTLDNKTNLIGTPFYLYFKEVLQNCNTISQAKNLTINTKRNNNLFILITSLLENSSILIESSEKTKFYDRNNFKEYLDTFSKNKITKFRNDVIFEYGSINELNNVLLNLKDFSIENIKSGILDLFKTGGNHMMMVNKKYQLFLRFKNDKKPNNDNNIYYFNLKNLFNQ